MLGAILCLILWSILLLLWSQKGNKFFITELGNWICVNITKGVDTNHKSTTFFFLFYIKNSH